MGLMLGRKMRKGMSRRMSERKRLMKSKRWPAMTSLVGIGGLGSGIKRLLRNRVILQAKIQNRRLKPHRNLQNQKTNKSAKHLISVKTEPEGLVLSRSSVKEESRQSQVCKKIIHKDPEKTMIPGPLSTTKKRKVISTKVCRFKIKITSC